MSLSIKKNILAIIPARGGSKGIKKKNLVKIGNSPLIKYTIDSAKKSNLISDLIVTTDSKEIAKYCKKLRVNVPFIRPKHLSTDKASTLDVILHAEKIYSKLSKKNFDYILLLQPTTPFRATSLIDKSIKKLIKSGADALVTLSDVGANHPFRMYELSNSYKIKPLLKNKTPMLGRQYLPKFYIRSGEIYLVSNKILKKYKTLLPKNTIGYISNNKNNINIDSYQDLALAKVFLK